MRQSKPLRSTALIVEDDPMQREMLHVLLEECDYDVIQCESAEAAERVLQKVAGCIDLLMTDVQLAGRMNGVELAHCEVPQPRPRRGRDLGQAAARTLA